MEQQQANHFEALSSQVIPHSLEISSDRTQKRLKQITLSVGIQPNPEGTLNNSFSRNTPKKSERKMKTQSNTRHKAEHSQKVEATIIKQQMIQELNSIRRAKLSNALKLKNTSHTLQKLKLQKQVAYTIRREQELVKSIHQQQIKIKKQLQQQQQRKRSIQRKRQLIKQKLQKISVQKQKREQILSTKSMPMIPRYKIIEKQFMMEQIRKEIQKNMQIKQNKQLKLLKYAQSIDKGLRRHKNISSEIHSSKVKTEPNEKQILKKRKEMIEHFQQKRKKIKININKQARHQLQIQKDKLLSPYKYNYLRLKQLSDEQIYREFKDFSLQIDRNALGKQYFEQSKEKINKLYSKHNISLASSSRQESKIQTGRSQSLSHQQRKKRIATLPQTDQISSILRENQSKSKIIELLNNQMQKTKKNMDTKMPQLTKSKPYQQFLKLQANIDQDYLSFLKAKIVSLQVHLQS